MEFQWLKDYQELEEQILYLKWNLNKSKLELQRWVCGDLADVRLEKNSRASSLEEIIAKIEQEIELLEEQRTEMLAIINSFKGIDNEIIKKKYIDGCSLDVIADEIGYSISYVRKRYTEINKTLAYIDNYKNSKQRKNYFNEEIEYYQDKLNQIHGN
ncbi:hypothetical protein [Enterococcus italicus]|uniref:hypothetical protein n=1 Tax=Enterococcus italicus TaxID=246144 RepID=UPI003FA2F603